MHGYQEHADVEMIRDIALGVVRWLRLRSRNTDAPEVIDRRLRVARDELRHYQEYDYIIVNDDLDRAYDVLRSVYVSETFRCARQRAAAEAVLSGQQVLNIGGRAVTGPEGA